MCKENGNIFIWKMVYDLMVIDIIFVCWGDGNKKSFEMIYFCLLCVGRVKGYC